MPALLKTHTLGCKVNQYETELVRQALSDVGFESVGDDRAADLCVVNTCTVTAEGDAKSRKAIRRLARENPHARIVVMGCYATREPDALTDLPGVEEVVTDKRELPDVLGRFGVVDLPTGVAGFAGRHRAYVKVQDGCLLNCSFCIIPQVRPHFASRPVEHIEREVCELVSAGHREVVLTGIHLGHYGVEWNRGRRKDQWVRLADLLRRLVKIPGDFRIRLSSIEATEVTRELIGAMAAHPQKICPHLHISMQSGSDAVLRRMRRRWGAKRFVDRCRLFRDSLDRPAITTDVIVGFPGETDADFAATCDACRQAGFSKIHIFPFSRRKGTDAATMPNQVYPSVKTDRVHRLAELETELRRDYVEQLVGAELQMLVEDDSSDAVAGASCRYVHVSAPKDGAIAAGDLAAVRAVYVDGNARVRGELL